ncbi:MAG TPA: hypothetical protein VLB29_10215 [Nocardioidaceae bacterium]|nr:hypothetical protein [Nocardioidaceae bacterium]
MYADEGGGLPEPWRFVAEFGTPWLVASFLAGRRCPNPWRAALMGALTIALGLLSYYCWLLFIEGVVLDTVIRHYESPGWIAVGGLIGSGFGLLGLASRVHPHALLRDGAWSVLAAVPLAEAWRAMQWTYVADYLVLVGGLLLGAALTMLWAVRLSGARLGVLSLGTLLAAVVLAQAQHLVIHAVH